jgi:aminomethyltransferase
MALDLRHTPLHLEHQSLGAKCADFGGWEMPIEYSGAVAEHQAVRTAVGIFDVSHMGKLRITGPGAVTSLNSVVTSDLGKITAGQAQYSMLCNEHGGVIDDFIVYRYSDDDLFIIPNATNAQTVAEELRKALPQNITVVDQHDDFGIIAVQGPESPRVLEALGLSTELAYMSFSTSIFLTADSAENSIMVCRTGYTGEIGFELVVPAPALVEVWRALLEAAEPLGGLPVGLGARDILRTEMGYPLHGQDISRDITPVEALLSWTVGWAKPEFQGRQSLVTMREQGAPRKRVALQVKGRGIPRAHMGVFSDPELSHRVGEITSGTYSPTLKQGIALALVESSALDSDPIGFYVDARGKALDCERTSLPFIPTSPQ